MTGASTERESVVSSEKGNGHPAPSEEGQGAPKVPPQKWPQEEQ